MRPKGDIMWPAGGNFSIIPRAGCRISNITMVGLILHKSPFLALLGGTLVNYYYHSSVENCQLLRHSG